MKLLWIVLILMTVGLQFRLWVGEGSFAEVWKLQNLNKEQVLVNERLAERNKRLRAEVLDLGKGYVAIEERARSSLGMIGPNEAFFLVVKADH